jgi:pectinesterase
LGTFDEPSHPPVTPIGVPTPQVKRGGLATFRLRPTAPIPLILLLAGGLGSAACGGKSAGPSGGTGGAGASAGTGGSPGNGGNPGTGGGVGGTTGTGGLGMVSCNGGVSPTGGGAGTAAGGDSGVAGAGSLTGLAGTPNRPLLTADQASSFTILRYLARFGPVTTPTTDNWDPTGGIDLTGVTPAAIVAQSGGSHTSVQRAIDAAVAMCPGTRRIYIQVMPGTYRETVCVPGAAPPITLYSTESSPAMQPVIVSGNYASKAKGETASANPCNANINPNPAVPNVTYQTYGTSGSATFAAYAAGFQAKNLTFSNDADETGVTTGTQAVALMTQGDKLVFENVRLLGNQDTLYVKSSNVNTIVRAYFKNCYVEGDVDFIFGRATMVLDGCEIKYRTNRRGPSNGGDVIAPSTDARNPYGILITGGMFTADSDAAAGSVGLGRAWDEGNSSLASYMASVAVGTYPNGQALITGSTLGAHINASAPWEAAATSARPYTSIAAATTPANRLYEYSNTSP